MKKESRIEKCPHCGSDWGAMTKMTLINVPKAYRFDGSEDYNGEMYDNAEKIIDKPTVYCQRCGKAICSWNVFCRRNDIVPF